MRPKLRTAAPKRKRVETSYTSPRSAAKPLAFWVKMDWWMNFSCKPRRIRSIWAGVAQANRSLVHTEVPQRLSRGAGAAL